MILNAFSRDTRGVSIAIDHALGLLILLVLTGIFVGGVTDIHDERQEAVTEQELNRISGEVTTGLLAVDSMAENADVRETRAGSADGTYTATRVSLPPSIGGDAYTVSVTDTEDGEVTVIAQSGGVTVEETISVENEVEGGNSGNDIVFKYEGGTITTEGE